MYVKSRHVIAAVHFKSALHCSLHVRMTSSAVVELGYVDGIGPYSSMDLVDQAADGQADLETDNKTLLSSDSSENLPAKEKRVVRKATSEENGVQHSVAAQDGVTGKHGTSVTHKGHRRRRHARGRIQLKKGI